MVEHTDGRLEILRWVEIDHEVLRANRTQGKEPRLGPQEAAPPREIVTGL
jgi:hypothetical protein